MLHCKIQIECRKNTHLHTAIGDHVAAATGCSGLKVRPGGTGLGCWPAARLRYITRAMAATTASMLRVLSAATQMRPESTP